MSTSDKPIQTELVDLEKVLSDKIPAIKKILPGFVLNYLKRIIHEDWLNMFLTKFGHLTGIEFIDACFGEMGIKIEVEGIDNVPEDGRYIIASNHPLGGLDGTALMFAVSRKRDDIVFPVNDILMNIKNLEPLFIPINKHGSNAQNIKIINDTFASNDIICYFPFGLVSRKRKGIIMDLEWKSTFLSKAKRYKRDIIPTYIAGRNSNFFYNLSNLRKTLGIKANIEMLYLVDELYKQCNSTLKIVFGKPIPYSTFNSSKTKADWAESLRLHSYRLANNPDLEYTP